MLGLLEREHVILCLRSGPQVEGRSCKTYLQHYTRFHAVFTATSQQDARRSALVAFIDKQPGDGEGQKYYIRTSARTTSVYEQTLGDAAGKATSSKAGWSRAFSFPAKRRALGLPALGAWLFTPPTDGLHYQVE